jgi:hypothetical protein
MSKRSRRRVTMAAGAILAGGAIPLAGAGTAWAQDIYISYDGITILDTFPAADQPGVASGISNDLAIASGPASSGSTITAIDNATGDVNDVVTASGAGSGAAIVDATNSSASATNDGTAIVINDGSSTVPVTQDDATANNGFALVGDSSGSSATATDTGTSTIYGAAVGYAIDSTASAQGTGSAAVVAGIPSTVADSSAVNDNGTTSGVTSSDTQVADGALVSGNPSGPIIVPTPGGVLVLP